MLKKLLKKTAKFILTQPDKKVEVQVTQLLKGNALKDQRILITGGSRGLGYSMAKRFMSEGANVVITGRTESSLQKAAEELNCIYIVYDSRDITGVDEVLKKATKLLGGNIDSLVCNAGISLHEDGILNVSEEQFDLQFDTNLKGPFFMAQAYIKHMDLKEYKARNILFITSETADQAFDRPYGLTKAALNRLTQGLSQRFYQYGLRVNAIAPGVTITDMTSDYAGDGEGDMSAPNVPGRYFLSEEIAEVACFLLSNDSLCISGEIVHCNGCNHVKSYWM